MLTWIVFNGSTPTPLLWREGWEMSPDWQIFIEGQRNNSTFLVITESGKEYFMVGRNPFTAGRQEKSISWSVRAARKKYFMVGGKNNFTRF